MDDDSIPIQIRGAFDEITYQSHQIIKLQYPRYEVEISNHVKQFAANRSRAEWEATLESSGMDMRSRVDRAVEAKAKGNEAFKQKDMGAAREAWLCALASLGEADQDDPAAGKDILGDKSSQMRCGQCGKRDEGEHARCSKCQQQVYCNAKWWV